jgi:site-specific DNA-methyltransferase (cytosine-N4-specific)
MKPTMPTILRGDARNLPLTDSSVDLVVTSPPYFSLRSYQDGGEHYDGQIGSEPTPGEFVDALLEVTRECVRVLKPSGSLWVNLGDSYSGRPAGPQGKTGQRADRRSANEPHRAATQRSSDVPAKSLRGLPWRYALRCIDDLGLILRAEVIWSKPNGLPESVTDRVRRSHEQWFHFAVRPRYYSAVDEIREPYAAASISRARYAPQVTTGRDLNLPRTGVGARKDLDSKGRLPGSVWEVASHPLKVPAELGVDHFAAFPMGWPRRLILGWCPPDGVVLDPFGGTGTTALVATMLGRTGITVDASADYCRLAEWRAGDPKERARAVGLDPDAVSQIRPQVKGQVSMFDLLDGDAA